MSHHRWPNRIKSCLALVAVMCWFFVASEPVTAQTGCGTCECDSLHQLPYVPGQWARIIYTPKDTGTYSISDMHDPRKYTPIFLFEYQSDSGDVRIHFGDVRKNGSFVPLHGWCHGKAWNWDTATKAFIDEVSDAQLRERSRTRWIHVSAGDTIQVYRLLQLRDHATPRKLLWDRWRASDDVAFSIELIDSTTGSRMALIDTFYLEKSSVNGRPAFFSWYPTGAVIQYRVPNGTPSGATVAVRMQVFSLNGTGERYTRSDIMKFDPVAILANYAGVWKILNDNNPNGSYGTCPTFATVSAGSLHLSSLELSNVAMVAIVTPYGHQVAQFTAAQLQSNPTVSLAAGPYIVAARNGNGATVCTRYVYVP